MSDLIMITRENGDLKLEIDLACGCCTRSSFSMGVIVSTHFGSQDCKLRHKWPVLKLLRAATRVFRKSRGR